MLSSNDLAQWQSGKVFNVGDKVLYEEKVYKCRQAHTAIAGWEPSMVASLWELPPGIPSDVRVTVVSPMQVNIVWSEVVTAGGYDFEMDGEVVLNVKSPYFHTGLEANTTHRYKVRATNFSGESEWSDEFVRTTFSKEVLYPLWQPQTLYGVGDIVIYEGRLYQCLQVHTTLEPWIPPIVPALWELKGELCPVVPLGLIGMVVNQTQIDVSWNEVSGATGYDLEVDGLMQEDVISPFSHKGLAANSTHLYRVRANNLSGNSEWSEAVKGRTTSGVIIVPPIDNTVATSVYDSTVFIYTGSDPIQKEIDPQIIDKKRVAVLRGRVLNRDGKPVAGVLVTVADHGEFGHTLTREDGYYDMAVNGGSVMTLKYIKEGWLPIQRQVNIPWQDFALAPDVVMLTYDSKVNPVDLTLNVMQVITGNRVSDKDGTRQPLLLIPPTTTAEMILADGGKQVLTKLTIRATEYTVGDHRISAMPGELPGNVGCNYALEYSADEAVTARAQIVQFNQPVIHYVENFLNFPVGSIVPTGYYDRNKNAWLPSDNGYIIKVLSITNSMADLDIDGSGHVTSLALQEKLGVNDREREQLARYYQAGQSLWRVPITKLALVACSWSFSAPVGAKPPQQRELKRDEQPPHTGGGSIIEYQTQVLGEIKEIIGTSFQLCYNSRNAYGYKPSRSVHIPLSGTTIPSILKSIRLHITVAGRQFIQEVAAAPNQEYLFTWDGKDVYGRTSMGTQAVQVAIGYVYQVVYQVPKNISKSFGSFSNVALGGVPASDEVVLWQYMKTSVSLWNPIDHGLGGWTLDVHHAYDSAGQVLFRGDGTRRSAKSEICSIGTVAGNGTAGHSGDSASAISAQLNSPEFVTVAPDGSLFIADSMNHCIRRVGQDGIITSVAGNGTGGYSGDGGQGTVAQLNRPAGVSIGLDGSLFIADYQNNCIRKVDLAGIITTVAGNGIMGGSGDGGPATAAQLRHPTSTTVGVDGSLFISDFGNKIRRVGPDGIIATIAGTGYWGDYGDGGLATDADLWTPMDMAIGKDGSLYIADCSNGRIRRVSLDGIITTVAGRRSQGYTGDGGLATNARLTLPSGITVDAEGSLYIADCSNHCIRRIGPDGIINTVIGNGVQGYNGDSGPAAAAQLNGPMNVAVGADGSLYIADRDNHRIRRATFGLPAIGSGEIPIPAEDGSEVYVFDSHGRHLRTVSPLNGTLIYQFHYDQVGRLISVEDVDGNITIIERDANGKAIGIIATGGLRTALTLDTNGYLQGITCPEGKTTQLTYSSDGLLTTFTDNKKNIYHFTYDDSGYLIKDENPGGGYTALSRIENSAGYIVTTASALARQSTYAVEYLTTGGMRRTNTSPTGAKEILELAMNGTTTVTKPDGTVVQTVEGPDPRWGMQAPLIQNLTMTTPAGLKYTKAEMGAATFDPADPNKVKNLTYTTSINGNNYTNTFEASTNQIIDSSPLGLQTITTLDAKGHVVQKQQQGLDSRKYEYDIWGRVTKTSLADQSVLYEYDSKNRISTASDAAGNKHHYGYDDNNNIIKITLPNGGIYQYAYDANDNCTQIVMPSGGVHRLGYTTLDQDASYAPPGNGVYTTSYDNDKAPVREARPSGRTVDTSYDNGGRMVGKSYDTATMRLSYVDTSDRVSNITSTPATGGTPQTITYEYDGNLVTKMTVSGVTNGQYNYRYDNNFLPVGSKLDNGAEIIYTRNLDGLLTGYGTFSIDRSGPVGAPKALSDTVMNITLGYDSSGRIISRSHVVNSKQEYSLEMSYNNIGKIIQRKENIAGVIDAYDYTYDSIGQLTQILKNGIVSETYTYDVNGNRISRKLGANPIEMAKFDGEDRLTQLGSVNYSLDADGFLTERGSDNFLYSATGELIKATLTSGKVITYTYDGMNRRVARTINGQTWQYLYGNLSDQYQITATLDADGTFSNYYYDGDGLLFAIDQGSVRYYVATDQVGTPKVITNSNGMVVKKLEYGSFGNLLNDSAPNFYLPIGFAGGIGDTDTGLVRFGLRDYDSAAGRWTARDPILFDGGQGNLYVYCGNDPVKYRDPSGQCVLILALTVIQVLIEMLMMAYLLALAIGATAVLGNKIWDSILLAEHTNNARPSTEEKHQKGQSRKERDAGAEKGDTKRKNYRKSKKKYN